jgi:anti-anti-sigma factor
MMNDVSLRTVTLSGEYDLARAAELRDDVLDEHDDQTQVVIDLTDVTFIDSSALRALLDVRNELDRRGATMAMTNPQPSVARVFDITAMGPILGLETPEP